MKMSWRSAGVALALVAALGYANRDHIKGPLRSAERWAYENYILEQLVKPSVQESRRTAIEFIEANWEQETKNLESCLSTSITGGGIVGISDLGVLSESERTHLERFGSTYIPQTGRAFFSPGSAGVTHRMSDAWFTRYSRGSTTGALYHELAHHRTVDLIRLLKWDIHADYSYTHANNLLTDELGFFLKEGIAEYAAIHCGERRRYPTPPRWPSTVAEFDMGSPESAAYGYDFVKPILDKWGFDWGVQSIFTNAKPSDDELLHPRTYWERVDANMYVPASKGLQ